MNSLTSARVSPQSGHCSSSAQNRDGATLERTESLFEADVPRAVERGDAVEVLADCGVAGRDRLRLAGGDDMGVDDALDRPGLQVAAGRDVLTCLLGHTMSLCAGAARDRDTRAVVHGLPLADP
jgi:hypothetical protein